MHRHATDPIITVNHTSTETFPSLSLGGEGVSTCPDTRKAALLAAVRSYSPYTNSPSGAAIKLKSGQIFSGFYIENCAFNPSIPPLQAAIINIVGAGLGGELENIEEVAIVEKKDAPVQQADGAQLLLDATTALSLASIVSKKSDYDNWFNLGITGAATRLRVDVTHCVEEAGPFDAKRGAKPQDGRRAAF